MEKFSSNSYSTHGHFRTELFVISFVLFLVAFVVFPKVRGAYANIRLNSAIDSAYSYKENIDNYYVSQLLFDSSFKFNGSYTIMNGNLVSGEDTYNILIGGNVPDGGYLNYVDNSLKSGCITVKGYSVFIQDGNITYTEKGNCDIVSEVALGI